MRKINFVLVIAFVAVVLFSCVILFSPSGVEEIKDADAINIGQATQPNGCCYLRCYRVPCSFEASACGTGGSACTEGTILHSPIQSAACAKDKDETTGKNCTLTDKKKVKSVYCDIVGSSPVGVECPTGQVRCMIKKHGGELPSGASPYEEVYIEPDKESVNAGTNNVCGNTNNRDSDKQRPLEWSYECRNHLYKDGE
ncbi:MAG: hypothetical protein LBQ66_13645 [Planctomycetaceae bacterium]|jgi:hypothetical protein|nr:hypothetical protein [Planctomycetaceae bacterium]